MIAVLIMATLTNTFIGYYDKKGLASEISKLQFIFLKMVCILPSVGLLFFVYPFKFELSLPSILLIIALLLVNLTNYLGYIGVVKKTSPYETSAYTTLAVPLIYAINIVVGTESFEALKFLYLFVMLVGVFMLVKGHLSKGGFKVSLLTAILSTTAKGYVIHYLLKYVSIPVYLIIVHLITAIVIIVFFRKKLELKKLKTKNWVWGLKTQTVGTLALTFSAILAQSSAALYAIRTPVRLAVTTFIAMFVKNNKEYGNRPTAAKIIGIVLTIAGVTLFIVL